MINNSGDAVSTQRMGMECSNQTSKRVNGDSDLAGISPDVKVRSEIGVGLAEHEALVTHLPH